MRLLYVNGWGYLPERVGGMQWSIRTLLRELDRSGHAVELVTVAVDAAPIVGIPRRVVHRVGRELTRLSSIWPPCSRDTVMGHVTWRAAPSLFPRGVRWRIRSFAPDLVVFQPCPAFTGLIDDCVRSGRPTAVFFRDADSFTNPEPSVLRDPRLLRIGNSDYVASLVRARYGGVVPRIYPSINVDDYFVAERSPRFVTFINPVPQKGFELFLEVAALLPEVSFLCVEGWILAADRLAHVEARLRGLPNVTFMRHTPDMRTVYGVTRLLLVPSRWEESFARVALEAQVSGIPVIAMDRGGLSEVIQGGGILMRPERPSGDWARTIRELLADPARLDALSARARESARRSDLRVEAIARQFAAEAERHVARLSGATR